MTVAAQQRKSQVGTLLVLRIIWVGFAFTHVMYAVVVYTLLNAAQRVDSVEAAHPSVTRFSEAVQTQEFPVFFVLSVVLVYLSRFIPKMVFHRTLRRIEKLTEERAIQTYLAPFIIGLAMLETIALFGMIHTMIYRFYPVFLLFGFVSLANMLIRFPTHNGILDLAEYLTRAKIRSSSRDSVLVE